MKHKPWFPVVYMFIITACFSAMLIGFSRLTRDRVQANERLMLERAVLEAFPEINLPPSPQVHTLFNELFAADRDMPGVYLYRKNGVVAGYAVAVAGKGFWAPIRGVVGVSRDLTTVTGIAFYDQNETPGLGARIEDKSFRAQFEGLTLGPPARLIGIRPPAVTLADNEVHAITGATQTCIRLEKLVNTSLAAWLAALRTKGGG